MYFNKTSSSFHKKQNNKFAIENFLLLSDKSRNNHDIMKYYSKSSDKNSAFNSIESKNIHNSFRKDIRSYKQKRKNEIDNFHKNNLNEYFCKNYEVNNKKSSNQISILRKENNSCDEPKNLYANNSNYRQVYYDSSSNLNYENNDFSFHNYKGTFKQNKLDSSSYSKEKAFKFHMQNENNPIQNKFSNNDDNYLNNSTQYLKIKTNYNTIDNSCTQMHDKNNQVSLLCFNNESNTIDYLQTKATQLNNHQNNFNTKSFFCNKNKNFNNNKSDLDSLNTISTSNQINIENFNKIRKVSEGKLSIISPQNKNFHMNSSQEFNQTHNEILINQKIFREKINSIDTNNMKANTPSYTATTTLSKPYNQTYNTTREKSHFNDNKENVLSHDLITYQNLNSLNSPDNLDFQKYLNKEINENIFDFQDYDISKTHNFVNNFKVSTDQSNIDELSITGYLNKRKESEISNRGDNNAKNFDKGKSCQKENLNLNENLKIKDFNEPEEIKNYKNKLLFNTIGEESFSCNKNNKFNKSIDIKNTNNKIIASNIKQETRFKNLINNNEENDSSYSLFDNNNYNGDQMEENEFKKQLSNKKENKNLGNKKDNSVINNKMNLTQKKNIDEGDESIRFSQTPCNLNTKGLEVFKGNNMKGLDKLNTLNSNHLEEQEADKTIFKTTKTEASNNFKYDLDEAEKIKKSIYYQKSDLIKSYNKQFIINNNSYAQNFSSISNNSSSRSNLFMNTDKNFYFKSNLRYPVSQGKECIGAFAEKTKFIMKQNYLKSIQEEQVLRIKEEFSNQKEEMNMKVSDIQEYKRFFIEDFLGTLEKYTRFCLRQKEREAQEFARLIDEKNNTNQENLRLERRKEKLFQEFTVFSEYKRFLLCVRYRIKNSVFLEYFLKQGGNLKIKDEIKNAIIIDNLRKKNMGRINNLKRNNNHSQGRRKTIFCNWTRVSQNPQSPINNLSPAKSSDKNERASDINNSNTNKNYSRNNTNTNLNSLSVDKNKSNVPLIYNSNNIVKENNSKALPGNKNKNMVLFKNLCIEGTSVKSIPIIDENKNLNQDILRVNIKKNSSERLNGFIKIPKDKLLANQSEFSEIGPKTKNSNNNLVIPKENSNSDIIASFIPPNKKSSNQTNSQNKYRSEMNLINISIKDKIKSGNNELEFSKNISDFSALLKSLKDLNKKEEEENFKRNLPQAGNNRSGIFSVSSSLSSALPNFKNIMSNSNSNKTNKKTNENHFLPHYEKSLEFINGISNQNEEVRNLIITKNSKGFNLVNKFFNPFNKSEIEKQNLLSRMYDLYNTKNIVIFESVEEFNEIFNEMQQRNLDLINIYNKNSVILLEMANKKSRVEKNNHIDEDVFETINKLENRLNAQKQRNSELKAILKAADDKHYNLRISETVFEKMTEIFEMLRFFGDKINDNFHIYDDLHPNINIFESLQMFRIIEKCIQYLFERLKIYKADEKYKYELAKILREIENVKKRKIALIEKEKNQANKLRIIEGFYDKCVRSDIYSQKKKVTKKYNFFVEENKNEQVLEHHTEKIYNEFNQILEDSYDE